MTPEAVLIIAAGLILAAALMWWVIAWLASIVFPAPRPPDPPFGASD